MDEIEYLDRLIDEVQGDSHPGTGGNHEVTCIRCIIVDYLMKLRKENIGGMV